MRASILAFAALAFPTHARADSFEAHSQGATRVSDPADLVWALTATCDRGDDVQQRQCRIVRDRKAKAIVGVPLLVEGDADALALGAWSSAKKSVPTTVASCVRCGGIDVDGHTWYLTGPNPKPDGSKLRGAMLYDNARQLPDEASAAAWKASIASPRFELVVKISQRGKFQLAGKTGFALEIVAWRVTNACDGKVVVSSLPSGPGTIDKKACTAAPADRGADNVPAPDDPTPAALTPSMVQSAMRPVVAAARACFDRMKVSGRTKLTLIINADGSVAKHERTGDFANTPMGRCIDDALDKAVFPRTRRPTTKIGYPLVLQ